LIRQPPPSCRHWLTGRPSSLSGQARPHEAWQNTIADYIHTTEASGGYLSHPVGITALWSPNGTLDPATENAALLSDTHADWISQINGVYTSNPPDAPTNKVVIADTDHIFGIGGDLNWVWRADIYQGLQFSHYG
jgi:hypothetical protein